MENTQSIFDTINRYCWVDYCRKFVIIKLKKTLVLAVKLRFYLFSSEQTIGSGHNGKDGKRCGVVYIDLTEKVNEGNISDEKEEEKEEVQSITVYYNQRYLLFY